MQPRWSTAKPSISSLVLVLILIVAQQRQFVSGSAASALAEVLDRSINRIRSEIENHFEPSEEEDAFNSIEQLGKQDQQLQHQQQQQQAAPAANQTGFMPIVFIPGDGGTQLEAKLNKTSRVHYICSLQSDWFDLWLNIHLLSPYAFDCLIDNLRLNYNQTSRTTYNTPGVEIRPTNFGSLSSVTYLDIYHIYKTDYFETIAATLEKSWGLQREIDMIGAGFDFRKAPNELGEYFAKLTELIERHYILNNYRPVTLICHSMGCLNSLYLLNNKTQNWKDVFVRRLISLGAPWNGSFKALSAMLHGDNLGIPLLDHNKLQALQSSFPSLMYLFPREPTFGNGRVLVETPQKNYTLTNLDSLFVDKGLLDQLEMWRDTQAIAMSLKAPNVELWCLYGSGRQTPNRIIYKRSLIDDSNFQELYGDGDGTVNLESLYACESFTQQQEKPVYTRMFAGVDHIDILRGTQAADFISQTIMINDI